MNRLFITLLLSTLMLFAAGQNALKNYFPKEKLQIDVSGQRQKEIERQTFLLSKEKLTAQEEKELKILLSKHGEMVESVWDIIPGECSWYCGGGNYAVKASSFLSNGKNANYAANHANDLSYQSAWVEGKDDEGVGEFIEYYFKNSSPRVTSIIISNGYVKSDAAWKQNNRVKKLKLYVNGKPFCFLNLHNSKTDQVFEVGTLGRNRNGTDLVLRFEIVEVYRGDKFNDTAITEIYFDGIDVH